MHVGDVWRLYGGCMCECDACELRLETGDWDYIGDAK
jgi:hypothetical protein